MERYGERKAKTLSAVRAVLEGSIEINDLRNSRLRAAVGRRLLSLAGNSALVNKYYPDGNGNVVSRKDINTERGEELEKVLPFMLSRARMLTNWKPEFKGQPNVLEAKKTDFM